MTTTITEHVGRFVAMKQKLGYRFTQSGLSDVSAFGTN